MNSKFVFVLPAIVVLATLSSALPVDDSQELDKFLAKINGTKCFSETEEGITKYDSCINVCVVSNGVRVCYQKCRYATTEPKVGATYDSQELDTFLTKINGTQCFSETEEGITKYDSCINVCVVSNGVQVCHQKCRYATTEPKVGATYDSQELDTFLTKINGTKCFSETEEGITNYSPKRCFTVCVIRKGVRVCAQKCTYTVTEPEVGATYNFLELDTFMAKINGTKCFLETEESITTYVPEWCSTVSVVRNGVRVCYQKCPYAAT